MPPWRPNRGLCIQLNLRLKWVASAIEYVYLVCDPACQQSQSSMYIVYRIASWIFCKCTWSWCRYRWMDKGFWWGLDRDMSFAVNWYFYEAYITSDWSVPVRTAARSVVKGFVSAGLLLIIMSYMKLSSASNESLYIYRRVRSRFKLPAIWASKLATKHVWEYRDRSRQKQRRYWDGRFW